MLAYIIFIGIALYTLQGLRIEQLFKKGKTFQIQLFYILTSIVIGSVVADFFLNFLSGRKRFPIFLVETGNSCSFISCKGE